MGMSMHVVGFQPADKKWQKMKGAWDACEAAGAEPPDTVLEFFNHEHPGDAPGKEVEILGHGAARWNDESREGYEVDITALPAGVRFVRFYCSWRGLRLVHGTMAGKSGTVALTIPGRKATANRD